MADRVPNGDPAAELPELSGKLRPPDAALVPQTLAGRLVPVVDKIRNLNVRLGVRPYRVFLVHAIWTGGKRGIGQREIHSRLELLPVPRVRDVSSVSRNLRATGTTEEGDIVIDRISVKYTEDDLVGKTPDLRDPDHRRTSRPDVEFWWEVEESRPSSPRPSIRRFSPPARVPALSPGRLEWRVTLTKQAGDRNRNGGSDPTEL